MTTHPHTMRAKTLAFALATFFALIYLVCLASVVIVPNLALHAPWLQFFPGFAWTLPGIFLGLVESIIYGLIAGAIFAPIYNFFDA